MKGEKSGVFIAHMPALFTLRENQNKYLQLKRNKHLPNDSNSNWGGGGKLLVLSAFVKLRDATANIVMFVYPSVHLYAWNNSDSHWTILREIRFWVFFENPSRKIKVLLKSDKNNVRALYVKTNTWWFISPSGNSELGCAATKTDTAERSISIGRESLPSFLCTKRCGVLAGFNARGATVPQRSDIPEVLMNYPVYIFDYISLISS
jgi:hypothetical protein